jgi:hypothetical protein
MIEKTKYALGDKLWCVDINGKVYKIIIQSIAAYDVARQFGSVEILAQQYPPPFDTIDKTLTKFYICAIIKDDERIDPVTLNLILWDDIIDHERTKYITQKSVYRLEVLPVPPASGTPIRSIEAIMQDIKQTINKNVEGVSVTFTDITEVEEDPYLKMEKAIALASNFIDDVRQLETIRPLIEDLLSIDFENLTTETRDLLTTIQARLSIMDAGNTSVVSQQAG